MSRYWKAIVVALVFACMSGCGEEPPAPAPSADAVVSWDGGHLEIVDLENAFATTRIPACRKARRFGGIEDLVPCYRELAEGQALESLVLAEVDDLESALGELDVDAELLRRQTLSQLFRQRTRGEIEVSETEIEERYEDRRETYRRPGQLNLSNIFRRHEDPINPEATDAFLRSVKERFEKGETFDALAREVSHSETRLRGGTVGTVTEDQLPKRLREVAFELSNGEVSEPIRVRGGAVLLYVQGIIDGAEIPIEQASQRIRAEIVNERLSEVITTRVASRRPPSGARVLAHDELAAAMSSEDPDTVVLDIAGDALTANQLRQLTGLDDGQGVEHLDDEARKSLVEAYEREKESRLLAVDLEDTADAELKAEADELWRQMAAAQIADARIREELAALVDSEETVLRSYWEDNQHHYQSALSFELLMWSLPFDDDPPAQLARMEDLHRQLTAGETDLTTAAQELGGKVEEVGWRDFDDLGSFMPGKARTYLMELGQPGFTVPYQQDNALHMIQLVARAEPTAMTYEEAKDRVRDDYVARFQQELYRRALDSRLASSGFFFDEDAVRQALADPISSVGP